MKSLLPFLTASVLLALAPACSKSDSSPSAASTTAQASGSTSVTLKGSDTLVLLGQRWAEELMKKNTAAKVQVTGGGSGTGLAALINGTTDIAMSSRPIKDAEKQKLRQRYQGEPAEVPVARDGVTFYVHATNPIEALTQEQLRAIYLGDITRWSQVGGPDAPIILYSRESSSGTYAFVKEHLLGDQDFAATAQLLPGTAAVVNAVSQETNGIGYGGAAYATGIKALAIKQGEEVISATEANIRSGKYPLSRDLYFYLGGTPRGQVQALLDFALSPEGQAIVSQVGYFPVK